MQIARLCAKKKQQQKKKLEEKQTQPAVGCLIIIAVMNRSQSNGRWF